MPRVSWNRCSASGAMLRDQTEWQGPVTDCPSESETTAVAAVWIFSRETNAGEHESQATLRVYSNEEAFVALDS